MELTIRIVPLLKRMNYQDEHFWFLLQTISIRWLALEVLLSDVDLKGLCLHPLWDKPPNFHAGRSKHRPNRQRLNLVISPLDRPKKLPCLCCGQ